MLQRVAVAGHQIGVLVLLEADAVPGAVHEVRPVATLVDDAAGNGVDVLARGTHRGRAHGFGLSALEDGVEVAELGQWLTGEHGAGDVRAVAVEGAAEVAHDRLATPDHPRPGRVVGAGRVGPAAHDGEVHPLVTGLDQAFPDLARDGGLGAAD